MIKISDLFNMDLYRQMLDEKMIREAVHPKNPALTIVGYSELAQFSRTWNEVTRNCRGLVFNRETGEVVARAFSKMHNFNEPEAPRFSDDTPVFSWANKWDGSLLVGFKMPREQYPGEEEFPGYYQFATRGSFVSDQAQAANTWLLDSKNFYSVLSDFEFGEENGYTPLFEWISPSNRIVLPYNEERAVPLGWIHIETGAYVPHPSMAGEIRTMRSLLGDLNRGAEGWVVWLDPWKSVKIKESSYIELHRVVTGLNAKTIWESLKDGRYQELIEKVPDELHKWMNDVASDLIRERDRIESEAWTLLARLHIAVDASSRKDQAMWINSNVPPAHRGLVFALLDEKDIKDKTWDMVKPNGESPS